MYDYNSAADDELTIRTNERLALVGEESGGWVKARNAQGQEGMVPAAYVEKVGGCLHVRMCGGGGGRPPM